MSMNFIIEAVQKNLNENSKGLTHQQLHEVVLSNGGLEPQTDFVVAEFLKAGRMKKEKISGKTTYFANSAWVDPLVEARQKELDKLNAKKAAEASAKSDSDVEKRGPGRPKAGE